MGGLGSGRWRLHTRKTRVEDCLRVSAGELVRAGVIAGREGSGSFSWTNRNSGTERASMSYRREFRHGFLLLTLSYSVTRREEKIPVEYPIIVQTTQPEFGGVRYWFTCPLRGCTRRVGKLYLPPGAIYLGCRHCHDLSYASCQGSDKRVSALRCLPPEQLLDYAKKGNISSLMLALKALRI